MLLFILGVFVFVLGAVVLIDTIVAKGSGRSYLIPVAVVLSGIIFMLERIPPSVWKQP